MVREALETHHCCNFQYCKKGFSQFKVKEHKASLTCPLLPRLLFCSVLKDSSEMLLSSNFSHFVVLFKGYYKVPHCAKAFVLQALQH